MTKPTSRGFMPLHIEDEEANKNPQFASLVEQLYDRISNADDTFKHVDMVKHNNYHARCNWFLEKVIYHEVQELIAILEVGGLDEMAAMDQRHLKSMLVQTLNFCEIGGYLSMFPNPAGKSSLFGLSSGDEEKHYAEKHLLPGLQQVVVPVLEDRLRRKCEELSNFFIANKGEEMASEGLRSSKFQSLPSLLEKRKQDLLHEKENLKQNYEQREKHLAAYYQQVLSCLSVMEKLLNHLKMKMRSEVNDAMVTWLQARSEALCLKVRVTELRILSETYTKDTVMALMQIGGQLDKEIWRKEQEHMSATQSVHNYHILGAEFQSLVYHFTQLQHEIENRKWSLQQLMHKSREPEVANRQDP